MTVCLDLSFAPAITLEGIIWAELSRVADRTGWTREWCHEHLQGWTVNSLSEGGVVRFAVLNYGPHVTTYRFPPWDRSSRITLGLVKTFLLPILDQYGYVEADAYKNNPRQLKFMDRLNFELHQETEKYLICRLYRPRWARVQ